MCTNIFRDFLQGKITLVVRALELWSKLKIKVDFHEWISSRIQEYAFEEGRDFYIILQEDNTPSPAGYVITLEMAKVLAMAEKSESGRNIWRDYLQYEQSLFGLPIKG